MARPIHGKIRTKMCTGAAVAACPFHEHVAAAALVGGAGAIVTGNLKDFPNAKVPKHIQVLSPAEFAADTVAVSPDAALRAVRAMASKYSAPRLTIEEVLNRLVLRYALTDAVELIRADT
jgi:hypothetical protein